MPQTEDLLDAHGAAQLSGLGVARIHQLAQEGRLTTYVFDGVNGLVRARADQPGKMSIFDKNEVLQLPPPSKGGRPRKVCAERAGQPAARNGKGNT